MTDHPNLSLLDSMIATFDQMAAGSSVGAQAEGIIACLDQLKRQSTWTLGYARASNRLKLLAAAFAAAHVFARAKNLDVLERMKAAFLELRSYVLTDLAQK